MYPVQSLFLILSLCVAGCTVAPDAGPAPGEPGATPARDYEATLTQILESVVTTSGLVDYARIEAQFDFEFDSVLASIRQKDPVELQTDEQKVAFYINAYNVMVLEVLRNAPGVQNIEFDQRFEELFQTEFRIAQHNMTLNQLENGILRLNDVVDGVLLPKGLKALRPTILEPRIHVGLNCGAVSCPVLRRQAFTAETLDTTLEAAMDEFVNSFRFVEVLGPELILSSIVDWYGEDFDSEDQAAGDYLLSFLEPATIGYETIQKLLGGHSAGEIRQMVLENSDYRFDYDWTVNRASG